MENENNEDSFVVNYTKVATEKGLLSVTRLLAADLSKNPYITIGDFLKNLNDSEVQMFIDIIEEGPDHSNFEDMMLIAGMLAAGEGTPCSNIDDYTKCTNMLNTFMVCESLYRKGFIDLQRENMSFGDDMADKNIARRK